MQLHVIVVNFDLTFFDSCKVIVIKYTCVFIDFLFHEYHMLISDIDDQLSPKITCEGQSLRLVLFFTNYTLFIRELLVMPQLSRS